MKHFIDVPIRVRPGVMFFAALMEKVLQDNAHKRGWQDCHPLWLQAKLTEELGELGKLIAELHTIDGKDYDNSGEERQEMIKQAITEAVDVANIAMMMADRLSEKVR